MHHCSLAGGGGVESHCNSVQGTLEAKRRTFEVVSGNPVSGALENARRLKDKDLLLKEKDARLKERDAWSKARLREQAVELAELM